MDVVSHLGEAIEIALTVVGALSLIVRGVAALTGITPGTGDDRLVGRAQKIIQGVQRVLGTLAADTGRHTARQQPGS